MTDQGSHLFLSDLRGGEGVRTPSQAVVSAPSSVPLDGLFRASPPTIFAATIALPKCPRLPAIPPRPFMLHHEPRRKLFCHAPGKHKQAQGTLTMLAWSVILYFLVFLFLIWIACPTRPDPKVWFDHGGKQEKA